MTKFRGCIDIHSGQVKQIVGGTLVSDDRDDPNDVQTNFTSEKPSSYYAQLYKQSQLTGCHVIKLGSLPTNDEAALSAVKTWPHGLQVGGGITDANAKWWIEQGASHVIITSWLFPAGEFSLERLQNVSKSVGKKHLVVDLSCRTVVNAAGDNEWVVAMNKWQTLTSSKLSAQFFRDLSKYCDEFLVHAADVEGLCNGIDEELVTRLGEWCGKLDVPVTYAGGAKSINDLALVQKLSNGSVDLTFGSALDIFGGELVTFDDLIKWNQEH
ncbi:hypothetical protein BABINDRAFT_36450 [Babjeviella inositovora NRRL Y-12698]|uniref:1-(5-phosphoribosyl)-5-[(5-phosphoribosylamino)methylideneamino] imidazole-4-carboxamide isomerase n=1 Tax=Babjeviella inositovora NRRL Y-12698 TaxID=984486 RepID=A0A1E3QQK2_9ASCO|nr:uncharacterized protein BABINDRAFT_36450 [Babjeviella inositovora NRRL Y-12698]ODQ79965.1 hypothetical protein BABINDRAFT_36450 [Babjeviella inositovora NRRL Y-12698]